MKEKPVLPYLTFNFSLAEMIITNTGLDNWPTDPEVRRRLRRLAEFLEDVRENVGNRPIYIHSGYRSEAVNRAVGGSKTSAHRLGYAADISVKGKASSSVAEIIRLHGGFDQLIYEPDRGIVHVSIDPRMRGDVFTQSGGPGSPMRRGILAWPYGRAANDN